MLAVGQTGGSVFGCRWGTFLQKTWWALTILASLFCFSAASVLAQTGGQGALEGTVTDPSGAVVANATVTATNQASNVATTRSTSSAGLYEITPLIPGVYTITVTASGFQTFKQQNIAVNGLNVTGFNAKLALGNASETVTVTDAPPELQTSNASLGAVITNDTYESLPLVMNNQQRDPTAFATLAPGAQGGTRAPVMSGTGNYLAEVYVDGIPTTTANQQGDNRVVSNGIPVESVDQLQVVSSGPSAEYQGAGAIGFTTKSGGDKYHGIILGLVRNTIFDTWGFAGNSATNPAIINGKTVNVPAGKPVEHQYEISASVGGPIPLTRKHGFFFVNYDQFHGRTGVSPALFTVPTARMKQGDFSQLLQTVTINGVATPVGQIYDPLSTATCTAHNVGGAPCRYQYGYGPGAGVGPNGNPVLIGTPNVIPASQISPIAQYLQKFMPDPQLDQVANNVSYSGVSGFDNHEQVAKVDFDMFHGQRLSFFFSHGVRASAGYGANLPLPYTASDSSIISPTIMMLEHSIVINPRMVNQFKYGFSRFPQPVFAPTYNLAPYRAVDAGITGLPPGQASGNFPGISFATNTLYPTGISPWTQGGASDSTHNVVPNAFTIVDNFQWNKGKHSITFGIQTQWLEDNVTSQSSPSGIYTASFSPNSTANFTGTTLNSQYSGYSYASFLLGAVNGGSTSVPLFVEVGGRYHPISPYVQDDWKITPNLTLNLGLRYDYLPPYHEVQDRWSFFNPNATNPLTNSPGALEYAGNRGADISCNCRTPVQTYWKNWGPRLGLEWAVDPKTVFRAGYAIAYSRAGGVGGRAGDATGTGQTGFGSNIVLPAPINTGVAAFPSYYLNNSPAFQSAGLANTNFGGPGYVIPAPSVPSAASLTLGTGNYVSGGKYVTPGGAPAYADPYLSGRAPEFVFYNFGMQRAITNNMTIMANYSGSQSHFIAGATVPGFWSGQIDPAHIARLGSVLASDNATNIMNAQATPANIAIAQAADPSINIPAWYAAAGALSSTATIGRALRPFPQYSAPPSPTWDNIANITYNALQITLAQRSWKGLSYTVNYTYSRNVGDDGSSRSAFFVPAAASSNGLNIPGNNRADRDLTTIDTPQNLNIYGVDKLPFGKGQIGGNNWVVRTLAGGWSLSGIFSYASGNPIQIDGSGCTTPSVGTCMPDLLPLRRNNIRINGGYGGPGVTAANFNQVRYLDPTAFALPQSFPLPACPSTLSASACAARVAITKIGDSPRTGLNLWTPSHYNLDMSVRRSFNISPERYKFEFQADCFNVTNKNTFNFGSSPYTQTWSTASSSNFGELRGYGGRRVWQFGGRINF